MGHESYTRHARELIAKTEQLEKENAKLRKQISDLKKKRIEESSQSTSQTEIMEALQQLEQFDTDVKQFIVLLKKAMKTENQFIIKAVKTESGDFIFTFEVA